MELILQIRFTLAECSQMNNPFRRQFIAVGRVADIKKYGLNCGVLYEITYKRNGYCIDIIGDELTALKARFIEEINKTVIKAK